LRGIGPRHLAPAEDYQVLQKIDGHNDRDHYEDDGEVDPEPPFEVGGCLKGEGVLKPVGEQKAEHGEADPVFDHLHPLGAGEDFDELGGRVDDQEGKKAKRIEAGGLRRKDGSLRPEI